MHTHTHAVAEGVLGIPLTQLGANPWWLYVESSFLESHMGECLCNLAY